MEALKGRTILIGRDEKRGCLIVSVNVNGHNGTTTVGQPGSVPNSVSRLKAGEGVAHCKIVIDQQAGMIITNLKPQNVTYVNGNGIVSKKITLSSQVALGQDRYSINVKSVLDAAKRVVNTITGGDAGGGVKPLQPEYSIQRLEKVWDRYHDGLLAIKRRQHRTALIRSIAPIFTVGSGCLAMVSRQADWPDEVTNVILAMFIIGLAIMIYSFYLTSRDKSVDEGEKLSDELQENYVCPNPKCRRFMGNQSYRLLRQNTKCPYCGCKFTS